MEERLGMAADARADELSEGQRRLEVMLDRLVVLYLVHTWEVSDEIKDWAVASANRRYGNYCRVVEELLAGKRRDEAAEKRQETAAAASQEQP
jgi:hypothetical protein